MADIGIKLGAEGESELKKAISDINGNLKVLGSELKMVSSEFGKNEASVQSYAAKNTVLNKQIEEQKDKVALLEKALDSSKEQYGENSKETQQWQIKLNKAKTDLNNMQSEVKANEKAMDALGDETKKAGNDIEDMGDEADKTSGKFSNLGQIAKAAIAAVAAAAAAAATALAAATVDAAAFADGILTLSSQTSVSTEKLQELQYASQLVDVDLETVTGSMARNVKAMSNAADGSAAYADAYEQLGVSVTDANGSLRDGETVYWEAIDALGQVSNETERDAIAMQLFGKSAQDLNPLIEAGSERMAELAAKAHEAGYVMSDETLVAFGAFDDQVQYLTVGAEAAKNALGTILLPSLTMLATDGNELLGEFTNGILEANGDISSIGEVIGETLSDIIAKIIDYLPEIIGMGTSLLGALASGIIANLPAMVSAALEIIMTLADGIASSLPTLIPTIVDVGLQIIDTLTSASTISGLIGAALDIITALAEGLIAAIPDLIEAIPEIITNLLTAITESLPLILGSGIEILLALIEGIIEAIPDLIDAIPEIIDAVVETITTNLPLILAAGVTILVEIVKGIINSLPQIVTAAGTLVQSLIDGVSALWDMIVQIGTDIIGKIGEGISNLWNTVVEWGSDVVDKIGEGISNAYNTIVGFGSDVIDAIKDGIDAAWGALVSWFEGIWDNLFGNRTVNVNANVSGGGVNGSHASGLDYVPFDGYVAELHRGEMVVPAALAESLRTIGTEKMSTQDTVSGIVNGISSAMSGTSGNGTYVIQVQLDKKTMAQAIFDPLKDVSKQRGVALA